MNNSEEYPKISAAIEANDRMRERRFAEGLPCLLTGLTKEQWSQTQTQISVANAATKKQTILTAADWIERIAQRHSELPKLFTDGIPQSEFWILYHKLRDIAK